MWGVLSCAVLGNRNNHVEARTGDVTGLHITTTIRDLRSTIMKVQATWHHVIAAKREIEIDEKEFEAWRLETYGVHGDRGLALAVWIDGLDTEVIAEVFSDWKTSKPLPSDFELQWSEVIDVDV